MIGGEKETHMVLFTLHYRLIKTKSHHQFEELKEHLKPLKAVGNELNSINLTPGCIVAEATLISLLSSHPHS